MTRSKQNTCQIYKFLWSSHKHARRITLIEKKDVTTHGNGIQYGRQSSGIDMWRECSFSYANVLPCWTLGHLEGIEFRLGATNKTEVRLRTVATVGRSTCLNCAEEQTLPFYDVDLTANPKDGKTIWLSDGLKRFGWDELREKSVFNVRGRRLDSGIKKETSNGVMA